MTTSKTEDQASEKKRNLLHKFLRITVWLPSYQKGWLLKDLRSY